MTRRQRELVQNAVTQLVRYRDRCFKLKGVVDADVGFSIIDLEEALKMRDKLARKQLDAWWETYVDTDLSMYGAHTVTQIPDPDEARLELLALGETAVEE